MAVSDMPLRDHLVLPLFLSMAFSPYSELQEFQNSYADHYLKQ